FPPRSPDLTSLDFLPRQREAIERSPRQSARRHATSLGLSEGAVTVTGPRYVHLLEIFLAPGLARLPVKEEMFFQQDGASVAVVNNPFPDHVISRYGDIMWPARSPDFSTCEIFLWGYLKSQLFKALAPHTVQELNMEFGKKLKEFP
ncbi:hypothetical protein B7P43_G06742, partial [Cryptotermes secundus]